MKQLIFITILFSFYSKADIGSLTILHTNTFQKLPEQIARDPYSSQNYFNELQEIYSKGTVATLSDLQGWTSGRCADINRPDRLLPYLLVSEIVEVQIGDKSNGPLFPPKSESVQVSLLIHDDLYQDQPDIYDNLSATLDDEITSAIHKVGRYIYKKEWILETNQSATEFAISGLYEKNGSKSESQFSFRKYGDYILTHFVVIFFRRKNKEYIEHSRTTGYCYFFKKVKD